MLGHGVTIKALVGGDLKTRKPNIMKVKKHAVSVAVQINQDRIRQ